MKFKNQHKNKIFAGLIIVLIGSVIVFTTNRKNNYVDIASTNVLSHSNLNTFETPSLTSQFGPSVTEGRVLTTADMTTNTPLIPSDIYRPSATVGANHGDLGTFAWLEFISLVSPWNGLRGETGGSFETSGKNNTSTLVWETYQHRSELFPYVPGSTIGRAPDPWDQAPSYRMSYEDVNGDKQMVDIPYSNFNNLDETTQIGMNILYFPKDYNNMDPDNDFEVLFEAKVNQQEWNFVNTNYPQFADFDTNFPNGISFDSGTIEVKATWRPLNSIPAADQYRYHTSQAIYYTGEDDDPEAVVGVYALIGLHIIHKTPNYPTFIFATFEHQDNLINANNTSTGLYYVPTYDEISYSLPPTTTTSNPTETVDNPAYPSGWLDAPYAEPVAGSKISLPQGSVTNIPGAQVLSTSVGNVVGVPVTQPENVTNSSTAQVNAEALIAMEGIPDFDENFVWQYYFLKGVQGVPSNDEQNPDYYLANIVTESSVPGIQLFAGGQGITDKVLEIPRNQANVRDVVQNNTVNQGGCAGCHGIAQTGSGFDFSFLYFSRTSGFSPEVHGLTTSEVEMERVNKYMKMLNPDK